MKELLNEKKISELYEMSSKERRDVFTRATDQETGQFLNKKFELAMAKGQKKAFEEWALLAAGKTKNRAVYEELVKKIKLLDEQMPLNSEGEKMVLEDLITDRLGISITPEEMAQLTSRAEKLQQYYDAHTAEIGNIIDHPAENMEYFKMRAEMDKYLDSLVPQSKLKIASSTIGRGNLLASIKSPFLNIESNTVVGIGEALGRRITSGKALGYSGDLAMEWWKQANKIYKETGIDISRMTSIADTERKILGEKMIHSEGEGKVRAIGRFYEDKVYKNLLSRPDVAFSSAHFVDSANLNASIAAQAMNLEGRALKAKAREIFKDATSLEPKTAEGQMIRAKAVADAMLATYQNESFSSTLGLKLRDVLNEASGDLRIGDNLIPFVKTPANVLELNLDYSGLGFTKGAVKVFKAFQEKKFTGELNKELIQASFRDMTRAGLGFGAAYYLSTLIEPEDFVGAYDAKRNDIEELRGSTYNAIKIGDRWISLDYFGPIGSPLVGLLYAKKYGKNWKDSAYLYAEGVGSQFYRFPVIAAYEDTISFIKGLSPESQLTPEERAKSGYTYTADFITSRIIPGIVSDIAKASDEFERQAKTPLEKLKSKIPLWRESLKEKKDILSESIKTEGAVSQIFTGARVSQSRETPVITEIARLTNAGFKPSITNFRKSSSERIAQIKQKLSSEDFEKAADQYGKLVNERVGKLIGTSDYQSLPDDQKKREVDHIIDDTLTEVLKDSGYEQTRAEKKGYLTNYGAPPAARRKKLIQ